jgi:hypothetical protein
LIKSPLSSLLKRPLSPDSLAFIASPAGIFSAPHFHSRFPEVPFSSKSSFLSPYTSGERFETNCQSF